MSFFWLTILLFQLCSLAFCCFSIYRLKNYIRVYKFDENQYTLLLGFIHLSWITKFYIFYTLVFIIVTSLIILALTGIS